MDKIVIKNSLITGNRIEYEYSMEGECMKYFTNEAFYAEYDGSVEEIPGSIAVIPILGTLLPFSWIFDIEIAVDEIDEDFYTNLYFVKKGYADMYPQMNLELRGKLKAGKIVSNKNNDNNSENIEKKAGCMFSGGVDAHHTLIAHMAEKPDLITIWGSDIDTGNENGWEKVLTHIKRTSEEYDLKNYVIKSSFRKLLNESEISEVTYKTADNGWWHGFHHGIGMLSLAAPLSYMNNLSVIYIASSFSVEDKGKVTCASDPTIDNFIRFGKCGVVHDGYEYKRQQKIKSICGFVAETRKKIDLRVCWQSNGGSNCCSCEKCFRTILGIYAEKCAPEDFGFKFKKNFSDTIKNFKKVSGSGSDSQLDRMKQRYEPIQKSMRKNYKPNEVDRNLKWFYDIEMSANKFAKPKLRYKILKYMKKRAKRLLFKK